MGKRYRLQDGSAFFLTTTAKDFMPIFINDDLFRKGVESLRFCLDKYHVLLCAFVFMPNHWHGILWKEGGFDLSGFMRDFKRFTSVQIRNTLRELGLDGNFIIRTKPSGCHNYQIWMSGFDAVAIRSSRVLKTKVDYIHANPVRRGLVSQPDEWLHSSARFYLKGEDTGIPVTWIV